MLDEGFNLLNVLKIGIDIALVWYVLYKLIMLIRGTKAIQLLKGIVVVLVVRVASMILDLQTLQWLTYQAILWGFLVIIILFQPELRRALEQLGRGNIFSRTSKSAEELLEETINSIDRKSTRLNSSHVAISYAVFCLKKKMNKKMLVDL